jgi:hypothetical protein
VSSLQYNTHVIQVRDALRSWVAYIRSERKRFLILALLVPAFIIVPNFIAAPGAVQSLIGLYIQMAVSGFLGGGLFVVAFLVRAIAYHDAASFKQGWIAFIPMVVMLIAQVKVARLRNPYYTGTLFFLWVVVGTIAGFLLLGR